MMAKEVYRVAAVCEIKDTLAHADLARRRCPESVQLDMKVIVCIGIVIVCDGRNCRRRIAFAYVLLYHPLKIAHSHKTQNCHSFFVAPEVARRARLARREENGTRRRVPCQRN